MLGLIENTIFCIDGQKAIDMVKSELDEALLKNVLENRKVKPVSLILIDF